MAIPKYVSAEEYSRQSGIGVEEVKRLCRTNQLKHFMIVILFQKNYLKKKKRKELKQKQHYNYYKRFY